MKKFSILSIILVSVLTIWSCTKDALDPVADVNNSIDVTSPANNFSLTLNPNQYNKAALTLQWTPADFGYAASVEYIVQFALDGTDFSAVSNATAFAASINLGTFSSNISTNSATITHKTLNDLFKGLVPSVGPVNNFKLRIVARPKEQQSSPTSNFLFTYSQVVLFTSNTYDTLLETPKIYVLGNYGAASTFSSWDLNMLGTSNSPKIFSPNKDNIFTGFVYTDNGAARFKFANPTDTDLNVYGQIIAQTGTVPPLAANNSAYGVLDFTTDVSTTGLITPPTATAGTYYVTANLKDKTFFVDKRTINVRGSGALSLNKNLDYDTNPTSPYYRMYTADVAINSPGFVTIFTRGNLAPQDFSIGAEATGSSVSADGTKTKMKVGGQKFQVTTAGNFKLVLDLQNSAYYTLRLIP
ncbi:MAG: hypothetical protein CFE24_05695 [Flavobacterium sp. BFFFF2]|nr:MAG: hypothetical protein CFE24_05695 [Flavobacterium sp. BFFFF2]